MSSNHKGGNLQNEVTREEHQGNLNARRVIVLDDTGAQVTSFGGGSGDGAILDGVSSSIKATVSDLTNSNPLATAIVDADGTQITSFGGGTQYTEDAAAAANPGVDIGDVDILSIAAGDNNIGNVDIVTVPADPFGANADAAATAGGTGSIQAKLRNLTSTNDSIKTAVEIIDDWDESDRAKVNLIVGQAGVQAGSGTVSATTQRVVLATDVALPAGTNAIGKLAANSGVDIGDVDVTSTTLPTLSSASTYSPTSFQNLGANATLNVKSSTGNVYSIYCNNTNASDRFIQLHNTATTPSASAVPLYTFRVPAGGDVLVGTDFFTNAGANFSTGIAFAFSTTKNTYTAGTAGDQSTIVMYK